VIPSEKEALEIHVNCGSSQIIIQHCKTVARVSRILAEALVEKGVPVDVAAVLAGALLHDIGRTRVQTVRHGYESSRILRERGVDGRVVEIVKKHVGAGLSREEASCLGLPLGDYIPSTVEERIVCLADKMVGSTEIRPFSEEVKRFVRKGHDVERLRSLKLGLQQLLGEDPEALIFEKIKEESINAGA
jgi:uncharacterized protein (TIGR00295 family)